MARAPSTFDALVRMVEDPMSAAAMHDPDAVAAIVSLARRHRVSGFVALATAEAGLPLPPDLAQDQAASTMRHLQSLRALGRVAAALDGAGLRWVVVKGPVLATRWHKDPGVRDYDDLDILVDPSRLAQAVDALRAAGFEHRSRNWGGFRELGVGELPLSDGTTVVDLHWHLVGLQRNRAALHLPTAELLERSVGITIGSVAARTLDDADTLVHLCVHDALAGAQKLVQLMDVHLVLSAVSPELAAERLDRARATRLGAVVIDRAERLLGPVGSQPFATRLGERRWLAVNRGLDAAAARLGRRRWTPLPHAVVGAGRDTTSGTLAALWTATVHASRSRLGMSTIVSDKGPLDWTHDAGGEYERERFFHDVAHGRYGW